VSPQPARRPSAITRPHPAKVAADLARAAEADDSTETSTALTGRDHRAATDAPPAATRPRAGGAAEPARLRDGRVSYAGKAGTVYFDDADTRQRVKAAFLARGGIEGYTSETEWWADVILGAAQTWENEHNGGRPFEVADRTSRRRSR
jgi:hypothetical protein